MGVGCSFISLLPEGGLPALVKDLDKKATRMVKKRTKAAVVQTIEQPDGKVLEKRSDGSQRRVSPDGSSVETFKDGSVLKKTANIVLCKFQDGSMLQVADNGDIIQKNAEGSQIQLLENRTLIIVAHADGRQLQWDIDAKAGTEEEPSGRKLEWNEEAGNRVELLPDGTIITTYSDGCVITKSPDGQLEQSNPDGTRIVSFPDGRRIQYNADGSRIEFFPDGSRVDYRADGVVIKQGSAVGAAKKGVEWDLAAARAAAGAKKKTASTAGADTVDTDEDSGDDYDDSDFSDAEVGDDDATVSGSFMVRGANFKDPTKLSNIETKILKEALSVIPYEMGMDVNARDVLITAEPQPGVKGSMKIRFQIRLNSDDVDAEMAEEVKEEVEESLTEKGGTVFANSLARTAKELKFERWLTDSFACSFVSGDSKLQMPKSWKPEGADGEEGGSGATPHVAAESTGEGHALMADLADVASGKSKSSVKMAALKRKLRRASKFKTLQGSIKIKGVSGADFDRSNHHHKALQLGLAELFNHLGLNESNLRTKLTNVLDAPRKDGLPSASVDYLVTLRGNARDQADSVVQRLKQVFGDSKQRKTFLANYWGRIPAEAGEQPQRKRRSRESKQHHHGIGSGSSKGDHHRESKSPSSGSRSRSESKHSSPKMAVGSGGGGGSDDDVRPEAKGEDSPTRGGKKHRKDKKHKKASSRGRRGSGIGTGEDDSDDGARTSASASVSLSPKRASRRSSPKAGAGDSGGGAGGGTVKAGGISSLASSILNGSAAEDRMLPVLR